MLHWDEEKRRLNLAKHGVDFADVERLDWAGAITKPDLRFNYGEERMITYAELGSRLHVLIWTQRQDEIRIIGFRKANKREAKLWEES